MIEDIVLNWLWTVTTIVVLLPNLAVATSSCGGELGWASREIVGTVSHSKPFKQEAGKQIFVLKPSEHGWRIGMCQSQGKKGPCRGVKWVH